jgi:folate-dependent phosphoribosylglycinamide formyltransferase PurN
VRSTAPPCTCDGQVDSGAIIAQAAVPIGPDDDAPTVAARVLAQGIDSCLKRCGW